MSHVRRPYRYRLVDVFTTEPFEGNPLAVFTDAQGLDDRAMQLIARELNLSETTFCFPTTRLDCVAQVRIFTPLHELKFAGHPTIGTSFVLLDEGLVPRNMANFALEEKIGPVPIRVDLGERPLVWLRTPPITYGPTRSRATCAAALGLGVDDLLDIAPQFASAGVPMLFIPSRTPASWIARTRSISPRSRTTWSIRSASLSSRRRRRARTRECSRPTSVCPKIPGPGARPARSPRS